jgi:hypothetical protein
LSHNDDGATGFRHAPEDYSTKAESGQRRGGYRSGGSHVGFRRLAVGTGLMLAARLRAAEEALRAALDEAGMLSQTGASLEMPALAVGPGAVQEQLDELTGRQR